MLIEGIVHGTAIEGIKGDTWSLEYSEYGRDIPHLSELVEMDFRV